MLCMSDNVKSFICPPKGDANLIIGETQWVAPTIHNEGCRATPQMHFYELVKIDDLVKSRYSLAGRKPESANLLKRLDSRFHGEDRKVHFHTFNEAIKITL